MDDEGRVQALSDESLAHEIERAVQVNPGPAFLAGVRMRIAEEPPAGWPVHRIAWALAAVCALLAAVAVTLPRVELTPSSDTAIASLASQSHASNVIVALRVTATADAPVRRRAAAKEASVEVLIAPDEAAALRRLLNGAALNVSDAPESAVPNVASTPAPPDIAIPFISIDFLESTKASEGVTP